jgi:non-ribosomal peptide synthetase component F
MVCVHADRSINWIIAIYGTLKAGGVYCPLYSGLPTKLRESYYATTGARVFLTTTKGQESHLPTSAALVISTEEILLSSQTVSRTSSLSRNDINKLQRSEANAYICFTSGSSGQPKGVLCIYKGLVAFQKDIEVRLFAQPGKRIAQIMSPAFDGSIHEIFSAINYGATLVLGCSTDLFGH